MFLVSEPPPTRQGEIFGSSLNTTVPECCSFHKPDMPLRNGVVPKPRPGTKRRALSLSSGYTVMFCGSRKDEVFIMATGNSKKGVIAILTGGGDVPGLNPAIRAVTIRALREGYDVIGLRRGWASLIDMVRDKDYDNSDNFQRLSEELVNRAGRTGGTFLHTSRTNPSRISKDDIPPHLRESYQAERNDLTPEVLKNLAWLGIDYLIPIGGDDTLSYAVRLFQEGVKVVAIPEDHGQRRSGHRLLHRLQHLRDPHHRNGQPAAHLRWLARTASGAGGLRPLRRIHRHAANHGRRCQSLRHSRVQVQHRSPDRVARSTIATRTPASIQSSWCPKVRCLRAAT